MKKKIKSITLACTLVASVFAADNTVASAAAPPTNGNGDAEQVTEQLESVGAVEQAAPLDESAEGFVASVADTEVNIPTDAADTISVEGTNQTVEVGIPGSENPDAVAIGDQVVYPSIDVDTDMVAQATEDGGVQMILAIQSDAAPEEFGFPFEGSTLEMNEDGSVNVSQNIDLGEGEIVPAVVGLVEPAWAVDANGNEVPTQYRIEGDTLIQVVDVGPETAFPVTADPKFTKGWTGLFVRWYRNEALWLTGLGITATAGAVATLCAGPHALVCGAAVAGIYYLTKSVSDWAINKLYDRGCRMETRLVPWVSTYFKC